MVSILVNNLIQDRLSQVIQILELNRSKFAREIGVTSGAISDIFHNRVKNLSDPFLYLIECQFRVNLEWLETGEGNMFLPNSAAHNLDETGQKLVANYTSLDSARRNELLEFSEFLCGKKLAEDQKKSAAETA